MSFQRVAVATEQSVALGTPPRRDQSPGRPPWVKGPLRRYAPLTRSPRPKNGPLWAGHPRVAEGVPISYELCCYFE